MARMTINISSDNRTRLELLKAFGVVQGEDLTIQVIVNAAIKQFFTEFCKGGSQNEILQDAIERLTAETPDSDPPVPED